MATAAIRIEGLDAFRREFARIDPTFNKRMGQLNKKAAETVEREAVANYRRRYRSMGPRTRGAIRSLAQARAAKIRIGGNSAPYLLGQEFGSGRYRQFPPHNREGYYLYPAIEKEVPRLRKDYLEALDDSVRKAFPQ